MVTELSSSPGAAGSKPGGDPALGPGVVIAVVVHEPSPVLPEVLEALAAQDYPDVQVLLLVAEANEEFVARLQLLTANIIPAAHVRPVVADGFGTAANAVLSLVEGNSGYFLLMHDDVALAPDAVRIMVEESLRSKAAVVGPKLLEWEDSRRLHSVGFEGDRFGDLFDVVEPHEIDQEQHDAIRDVFVLSTACLLVRADFFRKIGGFESSIHRYGEGLDFCWRVHLSGARVVVVPDAIGRHVAASSSVPMSADVFAEVERNRVLTVASLTGRGRLSLTVPQLIIFGLASALWSLVRGRWSRSKSRFGALMVLVTQFKTVRARRRKMRLIRRVPDSEIANLQTSGTLRWRQVFRRRALEARQLLTFHDDDDLDNDVLGDGPIEPRSYRPILVWIGLGLLFVLGGREILTAGLQAVGEFLPFPDSRRQLITSYFSGWWDADLGRTGAQPTARLLTGAAGLVFLGKFGLLQVVTTIGLIPIGWWGMSRLCSVIHEERARLAGLLAYAAVPLPYAAVASGRHQVLIAYAVIPWALHLIRSFGGIGGPVRSDARRDVVRHLSAPQRIAQVARLSLLLAVALAFAPSVVIMVLWCALLWLVASGVAGGSTRAASLGLVATVTASAVALLLNMPWSMRYFSSDAWHLVVGAPAREVAELGWWGILRFGIGPSPLGSLILVLYLPLVVVPLVARHSRFLWAWRAAILVLGGLTLTFLKDSGSLPFALPDAGVLLVPVACGLALGVALTVMSLSIDVRGGRFGWRQPAALISLAVIPIGLLPVAVVAVDGQWNQPTTSFYGQLTELLGDRSDGDHRTLVLGDARMTIGGSYAYRDAMAFSLLRNTEATFLDRWTPDPTNVNRLVRPLIDAVADHTTLRVGRLMAPLGIRYIVVPIVDRVRSTSSSPLPEPEGLIEALSEQLDLQKVYSPPSMVIFENTQWIPISGVLAPAAVSSSKAGGATALVSAELSDSLPVLNGTSGYRQPTEALPAGTLHWGVPYDSRWSLQTSGAVANVRPSFGSVMAFDLETATEGSLRYSTSITRYVWVVLQGLLWLAVIVAIVQPRRRPRRVLATSPKVTPS